LIFDLVHGLTALKMMKVLM